MVHSFVVDLFRLLCVCNNYRRRYALSDRFNRNWATLSLTHVGIYGIAVTVTRYATRVVNAGVSAIIPRLSRLYAQNDEIVFRDMFLRYSNMMGVLSFGIGLLVVSLGTPFLELWVGSDFSAAGTILVILTAALIPDYATSVSVYALQAMKKHKYYAYNSLIEGVANLALSITLVRSLGMVGVAIGTLIPAFVTKLIAQPIYSSRIIGIGWWTYVRVTIIKPLLSFVPVAGFGFIAQSIFHIETYWNLLLFALTLLLLYTFFLMLFGLSQENRRQILLVVKRPLYPRVISILHRKVNS